MTGENPLTVTLSSTSSTLLCQGSNPDIRGETPATCRQRHSTAPIVLLGHATRSGGGCVWAERRVSVRMCNTPLLNTILVSQTSVYVSCLPTVEGKWTLVVAIEHSAKCCCPRLSGPDEFCWQSYNIYKTMDHS